jgi:YihY family inner membrane protein
VKESRRFWESQCVAVLMSAASGALAFLFIAGAAWTQDAFIQVIPASWALTQSALKFINIKLWMVPLTLLMFFVTFYLVPNTRISWRQVLPAAVFTGLLWETSNYVLMWVLPYLGLSTIYGAFVVTVTLLTWAYISGIILVLGANLTARNALSPVIVGRLASLSYRSHETELPVQDQPAKPDILLTPPETRTKT